MLHDNFSSEKNTKNIDVYNQNIPSLRFPEFSGEWEKTKLGSIASVQDGTHTTPHYTNEGIPFYSVETITSNVDYKFISNEEHEKLIKRCQPVKNDILLTRIGTLCESKLVDWDYEFSIYVSLALIYDIKISSMFLNHYFNTNYYRKDFLRKSLLLAIPQKINIKDLKQTILKYPSTEEQEKIASFLSAIDKKIDLMEKKHIQYENIMKYFINNLFPNEKNYIPNLRFELYNKYWDEVKFYELMKKCKAGGTPKSNVKEYYGGNIPFLSINDMTKEGKYITYTEKTITEVGLKNSSSWLVPKKSLLYSMYASVGFVSINCIPLATSQAIFNIIFKESVNLDFMYYYMIFYKKYIYKYIETGTQNNLNAKTIKNFKMKIPSIKEQKKISTFLSSIDRYMKLNENKLKQLKIFKKGLLQKMFC